MASEARRKTLEYALQVLLSEFVLRTRGIPLELRVVHTKKGNGSFYQSIHVHGYFQRLLSLNLALEEDGPPWE